MSTKCLFGLKITGATIAPKTITAPNEAAKMIR